MNPIEQTSAQNFVPYAPFEILVINPDRFLKMRGMVRKLRRGRSKLSENGADLLRMCEACILGKHLDCAGCRCLEDFHSAWHRLDGSQNAHTDGGPGPGKHALEAPAL
jgi:hypothetical protein